MAKTKLPAVPATPNDVPSGQRSFFTSIKEILEVWKGDRGEPLDSVVTFRDLLGDAGTKLGTSQITGLPTVEALGSGGVATNTTQPPDVSSITTSGVFTDIIITWDPAAYSNHAFTEVWRFTTDTFNSKVFIGSTRSSIYVDGTGEGKSYYYWTRHVSTAGVAGNFALHGVLGTTQSTLSGNYITDATIGTAKIANLAVSDAKIATLTAAKITAGTLVAGESITVGTGGNRIIIDSYGNIRTGSATAFANGSGFWIGESAGAAVFFFGNSTSEFVAYNGTNLTINTPQFVLSAGNASFSGALSAATGTFAGSLSAATGTFSGALSAATGDFSGSLNAATGTFGGQLLAGVVDLNSAVGETHIYARSDSGATVIAPTGKSSIRITISGGGGGGAGGGNPSPGATLGSGGGGGGGGVDNVVYTQNSITAGTSYTIIVGAGGVGGVGRPAGANAQGGNGANGTASTVSLTSGGTVLATSPGANGGLSGVNYPQYIDGGIGGNGTTAPAKGVNGQAGSSVPTGAMFGNSTYPVGGGGGRGGSGTSKSKGGSGGLGGTSSAAGVAGSSGIDGQVIVEFFNPNSVVLQTQYSNLKSQLTAQFGYVNTGGLA